MKSSPVRKIGFSDLSQAYRLVIGSYEQTKMPEKAKKQELYNKAHRDAIALELHENGLEIQSAM